MPEDGLGNVRQESDPDDINYGGVSGAVHMLKEELFNDLTTDEVQYITGLDRSTVLKYLREGVIEGYLLGRAWRIPSESLRKFREHLLNESRQAAQTLRRERELEAEVARLRLAEPGAGWELRRCPVTNTLMKVQDEVEKDADAALAGIDGYDWTGNKWGWCSECGHFNYEGVLILEKHVFSPSEQTDPADAAPPPGNKAEATDGSGMEEMPF